MRKGKERKMKRISLAAAIAMVLGALVLTGCGGSSGGGSTESGTTTASAGGGGEAEGAKFAISEEDRQCLKKKGVELPEGGAMPGGGQMPESGEMPGGDEPPEGGDMPEGGPPGGFGGGTSEASKKAFEECGVEMPEFKGGPSGATANGGGPNVNSAAFKKQVKEYVTCVRENGFELAEPDFSGEGPIFKKGESESAAFKKASAQCQSLLGGQRGSQTG
jgi:hypothetical protein